MRTVILSALLLASKASYATTRTVEDGKVTFHTVAHAPLGATINVDGDGKMKGAGEEGGGKVTGSFVARWADLDTGMGKRNEHMLEHFKAGTYPEIRLVLKPWVKTAEASPFEGLLTLKGITRPVTGKASVSSSGVLHAEFKVSLSSFGIEPPKQSLLNIVCDNSVDVTVEADVK